MPFNHSQRNALFAMFAGNWARRVVVKICHIVKQNLAVNGLKSCAILSVR